MDENIIYTGGLFGNKSPAKKLREAKGKLTEFNKGKSEKVNLKSYEDISTLNKESYDKKIKQLDIELDTVKNYALKLIEEYRGVDIFSIDRELIKKYYTDENKKMINALVYLYVMYKKSITSEDDSSDGDSSDELSEPSKTLLKELSQYGEDDDEDIILELTGSCDYGIYFLNDSEWVEMDHDDKVNLNNLELKFIETASDNYIIVVTNWTPGEGGEPFMVNLSIHINCLQKKVDEDEMYGGTIFGGAKSLDKFLEEMKSKTKDKEIFSDREKKTIGLLLSRFIETGKIKTVSQKDKEIIDLQKESLKTIRDWYMQYSHNLEIDIRSIYNEIFKKPLDSLEITKAGKLTLDEVTPIHKIISKKPQYDREEYKLMLKQVQKIKKKLQDLKLINGRLKKMNDDHEASKRRYSNYPIESKYNERGHVKSTVDQETFAIRTYEEGQAKYEENLKEITRLEAQNTQEVKSMTSEKTAFINNYNQKKQEIDAKYAKQSETDKKGTTNQLSPYQVVKNNTDLESSILSGKPSTPELDINRKITLMDTINLVLQKGGTYSGNIKICGKDIKTIVDIPKIVENIKRVRNNYRSIKGVNDEFIRLIDTMDEYVIYEYLKQIVYDEFIKKFKQDIDYRRGQLTYYIDYGVDKFGDESLESFRSKYMPGIRKQIIKAGLSDLLQPIILITYREYQEKKETFKIPWKSLGTSILLPIPGTTIIPTIGSIAYKGKNELYKKIFDKLNRVKDKDIKTLLLSLETNEQLKKEILSRNTHLESKLMEFIKKLKEEEDKKKEDKQKTDSKKAKTEVETKSKENKRRRR